MTNVNDLSPVTTKHKWKEKLKFYEKWRRVESEKVKTFFP
jgi:hypothetical protein